MTYAETSAKTSAEALETFAKELFPSSSFLSKKRNSNDIIYLIYIHI